MAWNPTYKINLLDVVKRSVSDVRVQDKLRPTLKESPFKTLFGQRIVDEIVARTLDNKGVKKDSKGNVTGVTSLGTYKDAPKDPKTGKPKFTAYKDSLIFDIYKSGQKEVDLKLTGEMLASIRSENSAYLIVINLEGQNNRNKAQGHITGRYGKKGKTKPRDFLGLPNKLVDQIFLDSIKDYRDLNKLTLAELSL